MDSNLDDLVGRRIAASHRLDAISTASMEDRKGLE